MEQRRKISSAITKLVLIILAAGLFIGGSSSLRTMTPPYVQLSIQTLAAQQAATTTEVKNLSNKVDADDVKIKDIDTRLTNHVLTARDGIPN